MDNEDIEFIAGLLGNEARRTQRRYEKALDDIDIANDVYDLIGWAQGNYDRANKAWANFLEAIKDRDRPVD